jgi:hypothetical protein
LRKTILQVYFGLALLIGGATKAQEVDDARNRDEVNQLPCNGACAASTPPVAIDRKTLMPDYPNKYLREENEVEALVQLRYTVGTDGVAKDITVFSLLGPQEFADAAIEAVRRTIFKPGTLNGQPVEQRARMMHIFTINLQPRSETESRVKQPLEPLGARPEIFADYNAALELIRQGRKDEALVKLTAMDQRTNLNFYERGIIAAAMGDLAASRSDFLEARNLTELYWLYRDRVSPQTFRRLLRLHLVSDLSTGDPFSAELMIDELKKLGVRNDDPTIKAAGEDIARLKSKAEVTTARKLLPNGATTFVLHYRSFQIKPVSGSLENVRIGCRQKLVTSPFSDKAEWHVPNNWDDCHVDIEGTPGAVFYVTQFAN